MFSSDEQAKASIDSIMLTFAALLDLNCDLGAFINYGLSIYIFPLHFSQQET